jgi:hypothetical protein
VGQENLNNPSVPEQWNQLVRNINAALKERDNFGALMGMRLFSLFKHYIGTKDGTCSFHMTGKRRNEGIMIMIQSTGMIRLFHGTDLLCRKSDQLNHKTSISRFSTNSASDISKKFRLQLKSRRSEMRPCRGSNHV